MLMLYDITNKRDDRTRSRLCRGPLNGNISSNSIEIKPELTLYIPRLLRQYLDNGLLAHTLLHELDEVLQLEGTTIAQVDYCGLRLGGVYAADYALYLYCIIVNQMVDEEL